MNMTDGSIVDKLLIFALPIAASSIVQLLFNAADLAVIGKFCGSDPLAAVGANTFIITLIIGLFVGLSVGSNAVISLKIGMGDLKSIEDCVHTSILTAIISGIFLAVVGQFIAYPILAALSTPESIIDMAVTYFKIYFIGMPFIMLYNFCAAIMRSRGDTRRPLIILVISGIINVILNLILVLVFNLGVAGVAIATTISGAISAIILTALLCKEEYPFTLKLSKLRLNPSVLKMIAAVGIPAGMQGMLYSISNTVIQSCMNILGSDVVAANSAALNYEYIVCYMFQAFSTAAMTFIAQNYGAGNIKRCQQIALRVIVLNTITIVAIGAVIYIFAYPMSLVFTSNPTVAELSEYRLRVLMAFTVVNSLIEIISGIMRGYGRSLSTVLISIIGICGVRLTYSLVYFPNHQTFPDIMRVYPISWFITIIPLTILLVAHMHSVKVRALKGQL